MESSDSVCARVYHHSNVLSSSLSSSLMLQTAMMMMMMMMMMVPSLHSCRQSSCNLFSREAGSQWTSCDRDQLVPSTMFCRHTCRPMIAKCRRQVQQNSQESTADTRTRCQSDMVYCSARNWLALYVSPCHRCTSAYQETVDHDRHTTPALHYLNNNNNNNQRLFIADKRSNQLLFFPTKFNVSIKYNSFILLQKSVLR